MTLRDDLWRILNDEKDGRYHIFLMFITTLILCSVALLLYETFLLDALPATTRAIRLRALTFADRTILLIFLLEYLARLWVIRGGSPKSIKLSWLDRVKYMSISRLRFMLSPWGIIDLLALLPLVPFLRSLRVLRLLRLFRSVHLFRYYNPLRVLGGAIRDNGLLFGLTFGAVIVSILLSATMFFFAEYGQNDQVKSFSDTLWWSIVTISTVGFGDITPITPGGRVIGAVLMLSGMFVIATFAGVISATLVGHLIPLQMERVRMSSITDHIIIAGWNENISMLLKQLEHEHTGELPTVVIFAPRSRPEGLDPRVVFVQGDFTRDAEYEKVRLNYARTLIIIADTSRGDITSSSRDATSVLTVFTVRRLERQFTVPRTRPIHICAEILDPDNVEHAHVAGANEVLATALVGNSLIAHTAINPGVGSILNELLLTTQSNIYTSNMPTGLIDGKLMTFHELQDRLRIEYDVMLIGVIHRDVLKLNLDTEHPIFNEDKIVYIGAARLEISSRAES